MAQAQAILLTLRTSLRALQAVLIRWIRSGLDHGKSRSRDRRRSLMLRLMRQRREYSQSLSLRGLWFV